MSKANEEYNKVKNSVAFNVNGFKQVTTKYNNEEKTVYRFDDSSQLIVIKSLVGPFENGKMFKFEVRNNMAK